VTPLYLAGRAGNIECVQLLIAFGANPNLEQTPKGKKAKELARTGELQDLMETPREQVVAVIYQTPDLDQALLGSDGEPDDG
jgi:ankyrin repeat protein